MNDAVYLASKLRSLSIPSSIAENYKTHFAAWKIALEWKKNVQILGWPLSNQVEVHGSGASASFGSSFNMWILRPRPRPTGSESTSH